jgi:hypothetical protein
MPAPPDSERAATEIVSGDPPLVWMRTRGAPADVEHSGGLARLSAILRQQAHTLFVFEDAGGARLSMAQRRRQARWIKDEAAILRERCLGIVFIFPSAGARFVLSSVLLLSGAPVAYAVVKDRAEALVWADERLRAAGIAPTSHPGA